MTMASPPSTPAGWHSDPSGLMTLRWWDGAKWTDQLAPMPANAYPPTTAFYPVVGGRRGTNGMAVASLVLSILWIWGIGSLLAVIFGEVARGQLKQAGGTEVGAGMALAGRILGSIGLVLTVLYVVASLALPQ